MTRCSLVALLGFAVAASAGCRGPGPDELPNMIRVTGCLTSSDDELVLTRLQPAGEVPITADEEVAAPRSSDTLRQKTEMFLLSGMHDELRPFVGQRVRVTGEAMPPEVGIVQQRYPSGAPRGEDTPEQTVADAPGAAIDDDDPQITAAEPRVSVMQKTRFATTELDVRVVTPLHEPCAP